jgi:hypothetical protein
MKFGKLFIYAVLVSVLAGIVDLITNLLQGSGIITTEASLTFISFICWASYFVFGANIKGAWSAFLGFIVGIIAAILMFVLTNVFAASGLNVSLVAIPLAVFILVIFMLLCEKLPYFNNIAAIFLGTGMFFGLMGIPAVAAKGYMTVAFGELLYAAIGFAAGWITIQIRVAVENSAKESGGVSM